ncbi:hypothetical protein G5714_024425 [Onychostoma macrolepis]|uniref:Uncharacterized protein n=1 Tax=Onychostoma macrolepis TaxID=369639 RepID=A0A7J6BJM8_9TELE|nr:hypothetical protein G5714_024425 [Onychostoma macrolepis]
MSMSTIPTSFPESAVQSSSPELSDELTTALATGRSAVVGNNGVFSDESEKAESPPSGFPDTTLKTKEPWRQKKTQGAPVPLRSQQGAPVPAYTKKRDHTSSLVFSDASDKAESPHSGFSDATIKTTEH